MSLCASLMLIMMEPIAPQGNTLIHSKASSSFNTGVISDQELNDVIVDFQVTNVIFEKGTFNSTAWTGGGERVQFSNCKFHHCSFTGNWSHIEFNNCCLDDVTLKRGTYTHFRVRDGEMTIFTTENISANYFLFVRVGVKKFLLPSQTVFASKGSQFKSCIMDQCRVRLLVHSSSFDQSHFISCVFGGYMDASKLLNATWKRNTATRFQLLNSVVANCDLQRCDFDHSNWQKTVVSHSDILSCTFRTANLSAVTMNYCQFTHCKFGLSTFEKSTLQSIRLTDCDLSRVNLTRGTLRDITLDSVVESNCDWKESSLTNIIRTTNSSLSGYLYFNDLDKTGSLGALQFKLLLYKSTESDSDPICLQTERPITNSKRQPFFSFKIPAEYEFEIEFIHVQCSSLSLWTRLFPFSVAPVSVETYVSYIQLGRKIFYFREEPFARTGTTGFLCNSKTVSQLRRSSTVTLARTYSA